jgi:AAA+ superfamily predicted ATPase
LLGNALVWVDVQGAPAEDAAALAELLDHVQALVIVTGVDTLPLRRPQRRIDRARLDAPGRLAAWRRALGGDDSTGMLGPLAEQFALDADDIVRIAAADPGGKGHAERLWDAARAASRRGFDGLAQRIEARAGWNDLVLPDDQKRTLQTLVAQVRQRSRVYGDWGFAAKSARGLGIAALFSGGSGTGKTLAAEVLANELRLDLFRIDVASVVSKYIGETEKNLARVFDAAEAGGAILLFDEADALFGKRSEVRDSHDRYANIEVTYLLQRIEAYRGLSILTTNMKQAIDAAFLRRLRFVVAFPFPDAAARAEIWDRVFPPQTPRRVDRDKLARLSLSGGHIRNVALCAAFLAAEQGRDAIVTMAHLRRAAEAEFVKIEKPLPAAELRDWT